ncbi:MAG: DEAD/DEAH box helicase, partial [Dermatophilaceae bacterium]|nr:DEAD/DEAH box helicase [Dermatophilaceae bacterium]
MPKNTSSGAPKKARWSTEKKAAAAKKPHRGQGGPKTGSFAGSKTSRPASSGTTHVGGREWRAPRDEHRSSDRRDDRHDDRGGYQRRDDRGERRSFDRRDDRGDRGYRRREDRPRFDRDDRGDRGYQRRDDRPR